MFFSLALKLYTTYVLHIAGETVVLYLKIEAKMQAE